jgi:hypothetical protein
VCWGWAVTYRSAIARPREALLVLGIVTLATAAQGVPAFAQGFFDSLFSNPRRPPASASSYADPNQGFHPYGERQEPRVESGGSLSYCVRTCDGRYFPIQRSSGANAAQACSSFCPAAKTKIFSGGSIEYASASDGSHYKDLPTAFSYRDRTVGGCTCNGKDPYGLVTTDVSNDPTLRAGDIVATDRGFMAYTGGHRRAEFTPLDHFSGPLANDVKHRLAGARIAPRNATPVPVADAQPATDKRVQLER